MTLIPSALCPLQDWTNCSHHTGHWCSIPAAHISNKPRLCVSILVPTEKRPAQGLAVLLYMDGKSWEQCVAAPSPAGDRPLQPVLSRLQVSYTACNKLLGDQVTAWLQTRPWTYPSHCTSGISNKHRWQQPQDMRISFHLPSCSFTPRSPITRLRTSASLLRSHARQTLPARDKTQRETTCPLPIYQGPCVQC